MLDSDYKAWDECPDADDCKLIQTFLELVDTLITDIKHLEAEVIQTRYELSCCLEPGYTDNLRSGILSNLAARHYSNLAYQEYNRIYYDGGDPMDFKVNLDHWYRLRADGIHPPESREQDTEVP